MLFSLGILDEIAAAIAVGKIAKRQAKKGALFLDGICSIFFAGCTGSTAKEKIGRSTPKESVPPPPPG